MILQLILNSALKASLFYLCWWLVLETISCFITAHFASRSAIWHKYSRDFEAAKDLAEFEAVSYSYALYKESLDKVKA